MKEKVKSILLLIIIIILIVTRYVEYRNMSINLPVTKIKDISMILLIILALLKKPIK